MPRINNTNRLKYRKKTINSILETQKETVRECRIDVEERLLVEILGEEEREVVDEFGEMSEQEKAYHLHLRQRREKRER